MKEMPVFNATLNLSCSHVPTVGARASLSQGLPSVSALASLEAPRAAGPGTGDRAPKTEPCPQKRAIPPKRGLRCSPPTSLKHREQGPTPREVQVSHWAKRRKERYQRKRGQRSSHPVPRNLGDSASSRTWGAGRDTPQSHRALGFRGTTDIPPNGQSYLGLISSPDGGLSTS